MSRASIAVLAAGCLLVSALVAHAEEGVFLTEADAPRAVFPDADRVTRQDVEGTAELRARVTERLGDVVPSLWEERYAVFRAERGGSTLGHALIVEEIGKHRPITFVVGVRADGSVADVAVVAYREAYGGEVQSERFLAQYRDTRAGDPVRPYREIKNIAGATLSVEAASRAVKKAQALALALGLAR